MAEKASKNRVLRARYGRMLLSKTSRQRASDTQAALSRKPELEASMNTIKVPPFTRFVEKIKINPITHCWEWQGAKGPLGYGQFCADSRRGNNTSRMLPLSSPHRFAYTTLVGPIPEDKEIDHICNNRGCCNPDHLEAVTKSENHLRAYQRGRKHTTRQRPTHCPHGHGYTQSNTYFKADGSIACIECSRIASAKRSERKRIEREQAPGNKPVRRAKVRDEEHERLLREYKESWRIEKKIYQDAEAGRVSPL